jgi:hypothetical protein
MIADIILGDITHPNNNRDIIIGMNSTLSDVTGIGLTFVSKYPDLHQPIELGSVLSFRFDASRYLHMIICHSIGTGGWKNAHQYVRFGLDYLWHTEGGREYSAVRIGNGRVGKRDGANEAKIRTAMTTSFLPLALYLFDPAQEAVAERSAVIVPLRAFRAWHPRYGEERIAA